MNNKHKYSLISGSVFGVLGIFIGTISEKLGIARGKVPETISWNEFFSERLDEVFMTSATTFALGYALYFFGWFKHDSIYLMCSKCGTPFDSKDVISNSCPNCKVQLERIEGFYDRHPEFKK